MGRNSIAQGSSLGMLWPNPLLPTTLKRHSRFPAQRIPNPEYLVILTPWL
jgi:hypothetical protein